MRKSAYICTKVGAPTGGRVHWLLHHLPVKFKASYILSFDYDKHNYVFYRMDNRKIYDLFVVSHTSKHYYKAVYCNLKKGIIEFFGYRSAKIVAEIMNEFYMGDEYGKKL